MESINVSANNFEQCIKCNICTVYCPVSNATPIYPGPKHAGPDGERLRLKESIFYDESLKYCTNCKICEVSCPSNVKIGDIIQIAKVKYSKKKPSLRDNILSHTDFMGSLATPFAPIVNVMTSLKPVKAIMDVTLKVDKRRGLPKYSFGTFKSWYKKVSAQQKNFQNKVSYFHGCYVNYNNPQLGKDLIKVFNSLNIGVMLLEKEKCCGVPLIANKFINQAKKNAQIINKSIEKSVLEENIPVIATSTSCTFNIRDEFDHILDIDNSKTKKSVDLVTRYLYRMLIKDNIKLKFKKDLKPIKVGYHTPCHMNKLGWAYYSQEIVKMIPGVELTVLDSNCCGVAGTYGFKKENYDIQKKIGTPLFKQIEEGFDIVCCDCETCKWQIENYTTKKCEHPISMLAESLDLD